MCFRSEKDRLIEEGLDQASYCDAWSGRLRVGSCDEMLPMAALCVCGGERNTMEWKRRRVDGRRSHRLHSGRCIEDERERGRMVSLTSASTAMLRQSHNFDVLCRGAGQECAARRGLDPHDGVHRVMEPPSRGSVAYGRKGVGVGQPLWKIFGISLLMLLLVRGCEGAAMFSVQAQTLADLTMKVTALLHHPWHLW